MPFSQGFFGSTANSASAAKSERDAAKADAQRMAIKTAALTADTKSSSANIMSTRMMSPVSPVAPQSRPETPTNASPLDATPAGVRKLKTKRMSMSPQTSTGSLNGDVNRAFYAPMSEFIKGRLYFFCPKMAVTRVPEDAHMFSVDNLLTYAPFYADFGPLNIAHLLRFAEIVTNKLTDANLAQKRIILYTSQAPDKCSNAALLISAYMILRHDKTPEEAYAPISAKSDQFPLVAFRDAGYGPATYWIDVPDCLRSLWRGLKQGILDLNTFDLEEYEFYEKVENGDMNWIIPGCFLALATPHDQPPPHLLQYHEQIRNGSVIPLRRSIVKPTRQFPPLIDLDQLLGFFRRSNVKGLVRLNNRLYDRQRILDAGVEHYELYFPDGSCPPWETIVKKFMMIADATLPTYRFDTSLPADSSRGALAVHCKAGLGRTGSLICCWMMKTLGWTARECISWCRLMRPGSVVGPQQNWLETVEEKCWQWGDLERTENQKRMIAANNLLAANANRAGTETLAESAMGMHVPVQPNKQHREIRNQHEGSQELKETTESAPPQPHYNLRSADRPSEQDASPRLHQQMEALELLSPHGSPSSSRLQ